MDVREEILAHFRTLSNQEPQAKPPDLVEVLGVSQ